MYTASQRFELKVRWVRRHFGVRLEPPYLHESSITMWKALMYYKKVEEMVAQFENWDWVVPSGGESR